MKERLPDGLESIGVIMRNLCHHIERGAEDRLKSEKVSGEYTAWNFHARVWWDSDLKLFKAAIKQYRKHIDTLEGTSLQDIMSKACELYGGD